MTWHKGDVIRLSAAFKNISGVAQDPSTVTLKVQTPGGVVTSYVYGTDGYLIKDSTGNYHRDIDITAAGKWEYKWETTGTGAAAEPGVFYVESSVIT